MKGVRVPASSANLGPGFDTLGMALGIYLECWYRPSDRVQIEVRGRDSASIAADETNLIWRTIAGYGCGPLHLIIDNDIPLGKGLGSSAAALTAGIAIGNPEWTREQVMNECSRLEGHPDNAAACALGGIVASATSRSGVTEAVRLNLPEGISVGVVVPDFVLPTAQARAALPECYSRADAVFNLQRTALLVAALAMNCRRALSTALEDVLHQPYRASVGSRAGRNSYLPVSRSARLRLERRRTLRAGVLRKRCGRVLHASGSVLTGQTGNSASHDRRARIYSPIILRPRRCKLTALPRIAHYLLALVGIPVLILASWWSVRAARADLLESQPKLDAARKAVAIMPGSARAHDNAAMLYAASDPTTDLDSAQWRAAATLNPRDSAAWMALGLKAELDGNATEAEQDLLRAADINHMFKPAWALANFYFRAGQREKFWPWARKCLELTEHRTGERWTIDPLPVFELCWNMSDDGRAIQRTAIPDNSFVLGAYVYYLTTTNRLDAAIEAADRLYPLAGPANLEWLYLLCDTLLQKNRGADAVRVWNALSEHHLIAYAKLDPSSGHSLTNGDFSVDPSGHGFDWKFARPADIYERYSSTTRSLRFDINGDEPENCELIGEALVLLPARRYRLRFRYETTDINGTPGLHWSIYNAATHLEVANLGPISGSAEEAQGGGEFAAPKDSDSVRLALRYDRPPGSTRPKGSLKIASVALELLP